MGQVWKRIWAFRNGYGPYYHPHKYKSQPIQILSSSFLNPQGDGTSIFPLCKAIGI